MSHGASVRVGGGQGELGHLAAVAVAGILVGLGFIGVQVVAGWPMAVIAFLGAIVLAGAFLSVEVGLALLLSLVVLLERELLFSVDIPFLGGGLKPTDLLLASILAGWITRRALGLTRWDEDVTPTGWLVLAFVGWAVVGAFLGIARGVFYKDSLLELRPLLAWLLFFPVVTELRPKQVRRLLWVVIGAAGLSAIRGLYLYLAGEGVTATFTGGGIRVMSVNFAYLMFAFLLCIGVFLTRGGRRAIPLALGLLALGGLVVTFQRSAWVGLGLALPAMVWLARGEERGRVFGLTMAAVAALAVTYGVGSLAGSGPPQVLTALTERLGSITSYSQDVSALHRLAEWRAVIGEIEDAPIVGNGLGDRVRFRSPMYNPASNQMGFWSNDFYIHNNYLWVASKLGIPALLLFVGLLGSVAVRSWRAASESIGPDRGFLLGLTGCLLAWVATAMFGPTFTTDNMAPFVALAFAGLHVLGTENRGRGSYRDAAETGGAA